MARDLIEELVSQFGEDSVLTGDVVRARSSGFLDSSPLKARAILRPGSTAEASGMLRLCNEAGQAVVPAGGLTNLVNNARATQEEMNFSLERMTAVEELDPAAGTMTVQAGATLEQVQEAAAGAGLFFPLDLAARASATVGGLVASNAGGTRVIRFGMMRDLVLGLEVVLSDGAVLTSLNKMLKNNAGYDLKHWFIGSEGTLGVVTRAVLRLWPDLPGAATALLGIDRFEQVIKLLALARSRLGGQLTSFEVMWNEYYRLVTTQPARSAPPLSYEHNYYVLVETMGVEPAEEQARFERLLELAFEAGLFTDAAVAKSSGQRAALWRIREDSDLIEAQYHPTFGFDISLPITAMEDYVGRTRAALEQAFGEVKYWVYGHAGDGNLHLTVWSPSAGEADRLAVERIVYTPLSSLGGSISAEHGIGLDKKAYLSLSRTPEEIAVMRRIKAALDPKGIMNPGKIFDLG